MGTAYIKLSAVPGDSTPQSNEDTRAFGGERDAGEPPSAPMAQKFAHNPIISSAGLNVLDTVIYDGTKFRAWWMNRLSKNSVVYAETTDPTSWPTPRTAISKLAGGGNNIVFDDGRYYMASYVRGHPGVTISTSPDGLSWTIPDHATIPDSCPAHGPFTVPCGPADVNIIWRNPLDGKLMGFFRWLTGPGGPQSPSLSHVWAGVRATDLYEASSWSAWTDKGHWLWPDAKDRGVIEFYGATPPILVDGVLISFVSILHEDVADGIGYTVIATCRASCDDPASWTRAREPFLNRGPAGSWDAAMAWVRSAVPVGDTLYLFYDGYDQGHKIGNRQIGLATISMADMRKIAALAPR